MRRIVRLVLAGLGTCLIVFAVLMPAYVSSRVLKFPLNEYETATLPRRRDCHPGGRPPCRTSVRGRHRRGAGRSVRDLANPR